ncbi:MAG: 16S rRNA processing protein RimM [Deltaproteobacteria bacterium]|nr:16S rRNA processing protein RimM [Deltaproteobacteria bacterium]
MPRDESRAAESGAVPVGEIVKPHGIRGEVKIYPFSGNPDNFALYREVLLARQPEGPPRPYELRSCRIQGHFVLAALVGVDDRTAAEALTGCTVFVDRQELPATAAGEFYWHDLQGMMVVTASGLLLGRVSSMLPTGAHDILVVTGTGREYLIPAIDGFVVEIDAAAGRIVVDPPEGLLEING